MTTDLVVVVPGIMGSALATANGREVWGLTPGGVLHALRTLGGSIRKLELPAGLGDGPAPDGVVATGLMPSLHVIPGVWTAIDGYSGLEDFLDAPRFGLVPDRAEAPGNLVLFPYDWRLSNRWTAQRLKARVETALARWRESAPERTDAHVVFICHSMGGLVARWYLDLLGGAEVTRALVTLGTPHRGALKSLEQLVNGVRKGRGPLKLDLTRFARSMPSSYQLLPEYACVEGEGGVLLKTTELELPGLDRDLVEDAMAFHDELDAAVSPSYSVVPVVGIGQPTWATARLGGDGVLPLWTIAGHEDAGDGTVPRLSARPKGMDEADTAIRGCGEGHGLLAGHRSVLDQLDFILTARDVQYRDVEPDARRAPGLGVPDLHDAGEEVAATVAIREPRVLQLVAFDEHGNEVAQELVRFRGETDALDRAVGHASLGRLAPGAYKLLVRAPDDPGASEVHATTLVME